MKESIRKKYYTASDTGISYRVLNHWDKKGLLPKNLRQNRGWRKFNFIENVWIQVIVELRNFGLPLEKIAKVYKNIMNRDFEYFVNKALHSATDIYIIISPDGKAAIISTNVIFDHKSMLFISIKSILKKRVYKNNV